MAEHLPEDPVILLSYINTLLRDEDASLEEICSARDLPQELVLERLSAAGFAYCKEQRKFR